MLRLRLLVVLMVAVSSVELGGCGGEAARLAQTTGAQASSTAADPGKNAGQVSLAARHARPLHKDTSHETFLSTYHNPGEGISFRYPRNYSLEEGEVQERSFFLKEQEETPDPDGCKKPADVAKIMKQLEKIVSSVQIFTKSVPPPAETSEESTDRLCLQPTQR